MMVRSVEEEHDVNTRSRLHLPEFMLMAVPILVAVLQVRLVDISNLSRWKGGGFGMYADPHPASARKIWLTDDVPGGASIRLYPIDGRLERAGMQDVGLCRELENISDLAREHRNFPDLKHTAPLCRAVRSFYDQYGADSPIAGILPGDNWRLRTTELRLAADLQHIESRLIGDRPLCKP